MDDLRCLICLADDVTDGRWYPANVGPNLLLIVQDLCRLPSTVMEEQATSECHVDCNPPCKRGPSALQREVQTSYSPRLLPLPCACNSCLKLAEAAHARVPPPPLTVVILYDMICIMLQSCLAMLLPKLDLVIAQGKSAVGHRLRAMGEQEELLMRNSVLTYSVMCETITHMHFADDAQVNAAVKELALQTLLPLSEMRVLIRYMYYENLLAYSAWTSDEGDAARDRGFTVQVGISSRP